MAIEKTIEVNVNEKGFDTLQSKIARLEDSMEDLEEQNESLNKSLANSGKSVLDNGGAMGLLNDATGGVAMTIKDAVEATDLFTKSTKAQAIAQKIATVVIGTSTGAMKAFRIALVSTGIGAIVVGLGLLIANFEKISEWVGGLIEKFGGWRQVLMFVAPPIWAIIKALEALGVIDDEQTEKAKKNAEARARARDEEVKRLRKHKTDVQDRYDFEIRMANAAGKDVIELERKKRAAAIESLKAINDQLRIFILSGKATQEQIKIWNETNAELKKLYQDDAVAQAESTRKAEEKKEKIREDARLKAEKRAEDEKKAAEQKAAEDFRIFEESIKARDAALEEQRKRRQEIEAAEALEEEEKMLAEIEQLNQHNLAMREAQAQADAMELEAKEAFEQAKFGIARQGLDLLTSLFGKSKAMAKAVLVLEQSLAIAQVVSNAAKSIAQAKANLAATPAVIGVVPNPMYAVQAAATAKGIATTKLGAKLSVATILAQTVGKLSSGGNLGGGGGGGESGGGGGSSAPAPEFNLIGGNVANQIGQVLQSQQPTQAYVVAGNVTTAQSLNRNIINNATF